MSDAIDRDETQRRNCLRLRIDKDDTMGVTIWHGTARVWMDGDSLSGEEWASTDLASVVRWLRAQTDQFAAAYRAAPPTNETPSALAVPTSAPTAVGGAAERLARAAEFAEIVASDLHPSESMGVEAWDKALSAFRAAPPAAEPSIFQKPPGSLKDGAVRCNNPEPAPCGTCGGSQIVRKHDPAYNDVFGSPCPSCRPGGAA